MRKMAMGVVGLGCMALLAGCGGSKGGVMGHAAPDEFAVQRRAPLVIPPDFALNPPRPGAPRPQEADSSTLAQRRRGGAHQPRRQRPRSGRPLDRRRPQYDDRRQGQRDPRHPVRAGKHEPGRFGERAAIGPCSRSSPSPSSPRRRGSTVSDVRSLWIPAFAGMTC